MISFRREHDENQKPSFLARLLVCAALCLITLPGSPAAAAPLPGASVDLAALSPEARTTEVTRLVESGVQSVRLPLDWSRVEPKQNQFTWQQDDAAVKAAHGAGLEVTLVLGPVAVWAVDPALGLTPEQARSSVPKSLATWERYVRQAATHYHGTVRSWQVREQPNIYHFRGAIQEYFALVTAASRVLKAVDPQNEVIISESVSFDPAGLEARLKPPLGQAWQVWGAYLPPSPNLSTAALPLSVITAEAFPDPAAARPRWVVGAETNLPADRWVQYYVLASAFGVARFFAPADVVSPQWVPALSRLRYRGFLRLGLTVWAFVFEDEAGPVVVAWSDAETRRPAAQLAPVQDAAALAASARLGDAPGSAIDGTGAAPVLLLGPRPALFRGFDVGGVTPGAPTREQVLAARGPSLRTLPAVSADYGRTEHAEVGLYNRPLRGYPGGAVREEMHDGRAAVGTRLNATQPSEDEPWIYFDVDDSWLYFDRGQVPVTITLEVEPPQEGREQLGFSLYYDSVTGYKHTRWQWIEPGTGWCTYRVVLTDVSFTDRNGYDFLINAKGSKQDLWVASVTVEKPAPATQPTPASPATPSTAPPAPPG